MTYAADPRVDDYLDGLPNWQQEICREVRELVHDADPEVEETIKRRVQPYFVLKGNICALLAAKDHVNVFLYEGGIVPDPEGIITSGQANKTARTVAIRKGEKVNRAALKSMFEQIIANNRAGGWRRLKARASSAIEAGIRWVWPSTDENGNPITYEESDVNTDEPGVKRDKERLIVGDCSAHYTNDHYNSFTLVL